MNPIRQNFAHIKALEAQLIQYPPLPIIPIVAFSPECDLKVKTTSHVVYFRRVNEVIRNYNQKVINKDKVTSIVNFLRSGNLNTTETKKEHINAVTNKKAEFEKATVGEKCPKCGGTLVERHGKYGSFLGCSNFPKCRFSKQI